MLRHYYAITVCSFLMLTSGHAMALATTDFAVAETGYRVRQLVSQRLETESALRNDARHRDLDRENKILSLQVMKRRARADAVLMENPSSMNAERMGLLGFVTCVPLGFGYALFALTRLTMRRRDLERSRIFGNRAATPLKLPEAVQSVNQYVQFLEQVKQQRALFTIEECVDISPVHDADKSSPSSVITLPIRGRQDFNATFKLFVAVSKLNLSIVKEKGPKSVLISPRMNFNQLLEEIPELRIQEQDNDRRQAV